jgi:dihydroorotate dehydrogenase
MIKYLSDKSNRAFPIIGVGGIHSAKDAMEKLDAGASWFSCTPDLSMKVRN